MTSMMGILLTFPVEREVFLREIGSNMYGVSSYFVGRSSTEFPFLTLIPFIFSAVIYWIIGFNSTVGKFFIFGKLHSLQCSDLIIALFMILQSINGNALGLLGGSVFPDPKVALAVAPMLLLPLMIFAGFYLNEGNSIFLQ